MSRHRVGVRAFQQRQDTSNEGARGQGSGSDCLGRCSVPSTLVSLPENRSMYSDRGQELKASTLVEGSSFRPRWIETRTRARGTWERIGRFPLLLHVLHQVPHRRPCSNGPWIYVWTSFTPSMLLFPVSISCPIESQPHRRRTLPLLRVTPPLHLLNIESLDSKFRCSL